MNYLGLGLAHLVEQLIVAQEVAGSIPAFQNVLYWHDVNIKLYNIYGCYKTSSRIFIIFIKFIF